MPRKICDYQATDQQARNAQFGHEVGGRHVVMRGSEGKNNKDNDHGHKFCCRHIKLSTHSLGRVSAGLGMKTLNPIMALKVITHNCPLWTDIPVSHLLPPSFLPSLLSHLCNQSMYPLLVSLGRWTRYSYPIYQKCATSVQWEEVKAAVVSHKLYFYNSDTRRSHVIWVVNLPGCKFIFYSSREWGGFGTRPPTGQWHSARETSTTSTTSG